MNMTHNESAKTFDDIVCHLELETEQNVVAKPHDQVYVAESRSNKASRFKGKKYFKKNKKFDNTSKKGNFVARKKFKCAKKDKSKLKYYNCGNKVHFARECI